jgi:K+-sensing histidine kinase KdpD
MLEAPLDPRWPKILSLSVHEFRSPLTVVSGYIRMLLKDRAGPLTDPQRRLLEEAEKSCGRIAELLKEVSDLSSMEKGDPPLKLERTDLRAVLGAAVERLPPLVDREITIDLQLGDETAMVAADASRLTDALRWILGALRRELVTSDTLSVRERPVTFTGIEGYELQIGDTDTLAALEAEGSDGRVLFDEWRGGCGLTLPVARRILTAHAGGIWGAPGERKAGARIFLPKG